MTKKNQIQAHIKVYMIRRRNLRNKKGNRWNKSHPEYQQEVKRINRSINNWQKIIKRIEEKEKPVKKASKMVCEFMEIKRLSRTTKITDSKTVLAKQIFSAYLCPILGYRWQFIASNFLGSSIPNYAPVLRKKFLSKISTSKKYNKLWQEFKRFAKEKEYASNN